MTSANSAPHQRSRRGRFRVTIPAVLCLVAITVAIAWVVTIAVRAQRRHAAVEAIRRQQGVVTYDYLYDFHESRRALGRDHPDFRKIENLLDRLPQPELDPDGRAWLRNLLGTDLFHDVVRINLAYFYDESGKHNDNPSSIDPVLPYLGTFPRLRVLLLSRQLATDGALRAVSGLKEIEKIYLWDARVTDVGVEYLRGMTKLRYLHLSEGKITDRSLEILGSIPTLEGLSMQGNRFTDRGLAHLAGLGKLKSLWVCARGEDESPDRISDDGLRHLRALSNLEELGLQHTLVTDAGLDHLRPLTRLEAVYLNGSRITEAGASSLRTALPGAKIEWSWSR
jgi:hypothetical protein